MSKEFFGVQEMKEFAESSEDPRVKAMWKMIERLRSQNARWCERDVRLSDMINDLLRHYESDDEYVYVKIDSEVYQEARRISRPMILREVKEQ